MEQAEGQAVRCHPQATEHLPTTTGRRAPAPPGGQDTCGYLGCMCVLVLGSLVTRTWLLLSGSTTTPHSNAFAAGMVTAGEGSPPYEINPVSVQLLAGVQCCTTTTASLTRTVSVPWCLQGARPAGCGLR